MTATIYDIAKGKAPVDAIEPSSALDVLIYVNFKGHKDLVVKGRPHPSYINRVTKPSVSLERFLSQTFEAFYNGDKDKLFAAWVRITNTMASHDANLVYRASVGELKIDEKSAREYSERRGLKAFDDKKAKPVDKKAERKEKKPVANKRDNKWQA